MRDDVVVIGLGYVGLPLALKLAQFCDVIGFDVSIDRVKELSNGEDRTQVARKDKLLTSSLHLTSDVNKISDRSIYIVAVPTPVDRENKPDLSALRTACKIIGPALKKNAIVVFESTVYPGVTETVCKLELEMASGLICGDDFFLGYSPERINPGDSVHSIEKITKIVAGQTPAVSKKLAKLYGTINDNNIFVARDIRTAEAAKVIENAQRDINIAFVNEISMICNKIGLSTSDVLAAAKTKWNFLDFTPGLVGGHCIGVDPYYLAHLSEKIGHHPKVILAGRRLNDEMANFVAEQIHGKLRFKSSKILLLGLTFKAGVPDLRNSGSAELFKILKLKGHNVDVYDPLASPTEAKKVYNIKLLKNLEKIGPYNCIIGSVPHDTFESLTGKILLSLSSHMGLIADLSGMWRKIKLPNTICRWEL